MTSPLFYIIYASLHSQHSYQCSDKVVCTYNIQIEEGKKEKGRIRAERQNCRWEIIIKERDWLIVLFNFST